jgi:hypothetical protein
VAAEPVSARELTALHERIGGEVDELRRRARGLERRARAVTASRAVEPADAADAAIEAMRTLRVIRRMPPSLGLALVVLTGLAAGMAVRVRPK